MTERRINEVTPEPKKIKTVPLFANEQEERDFWESPDRDSTEYADWCKAQKVVLRDLKLTTPHPPIADTRSG